LNVVVETGASELPYPSYCDLWQSEHGHVEVVTLYDPDGAIFSLWPGGSTSLSAFVDADRIIRAKLVHEADLTIIRAELESVLADE